MINLHAHIDFARYRGLRSLQHRTYFWFWFGQMFVLTSAWMMDMARSWLTYELTNDPFKLGLLNFVANAPILLLGLFTGTIIDRYNRQRLLSRTQLTLGCVGLIMFLLSAIIGADGAPLVRYWHLLCLAFFVGMVSMIDMPTRQSILAQMVPRADLPNALALNSMVFNLTRIIGPSIAGVLVAQVAFRGFGMHVSGISLCFLFNALCFIAVSFQTRMLNIEPQPQTHQHLGAIHHLKEGMHYCIASPHIGAITIYTGFIALFGLPYLTVLPVFAKDVFGGNAATLGRLMACVGVGALCGALLMTMIRSLETSMRLIGIASLGFAVCMTVFAHAPYLWIAKTAILLGGFMMALLMVGCQTVVQTLVNERFRGRVNAFYTVTAVGFMPIGSLCIGFWAARLGAPTALTINNICIFIVGLGYMYFKPKLLKRAKQTPEYQQLAVLPDA